MSWGGGHLGVLADNPVSRGQSQGAREVMRMTMAELMGSQTVLQERNGTQVGQTQSGTERKV